MKARLAMTWLVLLTTAGCDSECRQEPACAPALPEKTRIMSAAPLPAESVGLFLSLEARTGVWNRPYESFCNVRLQVLFNLSVPSNTFKKTTFYAEQNGVYYALRTLEDSGRSFNSPYSASGSLVTLPCPPTSGRWNLFAILEHSTVAFKKARADRSIKSDKISAFAEETDSHGAVTLASRVISNAVNVEFVEVSAKAYENAIQSFIDAGQFKPEFKKPVADPTQGRSEEFVRWRTPVQVRKPFEKK